MERQDAAEIFAADNMPDNTSRQETSFSKQPFAKTQTLNAMSEYPRTSYPHNSAKQTEAASYQNIFSKLLMEKSFAEAVEFQEQQESEQPASTAVLKKILIAYLEKALQQGDYSAFMDLIDYSLARDYDDIDLLLLLAEYHRLQAYYDEAIRSYQMVFAYAYKASDKAKAMVQLQKMISSTDSLLSKDAYWLELLGIYQLLDSLSLSNAAYKLRQVELYHLLGEDGQAKQLLTALADDPVAGARAQQLLATMHDAGQTATQTHAEGIALQRRGNHYLVEVSFGRRADAVLMIDTGASVTTLSRRHFDSLSQSVHFEKIAERLFNTANGVARGNVYRVDQMRLGDNILENVQVAVLDYQSADAVAGLLGMNVLKKFRFEIDQDAQMLYLRER
jgi:clan AA aspartic protease (TIGR02281 family)